LGHIEEPDFTPLVAVHLVQPDIDALELIRSPKEARVDPTGATSKREGRIATSRSTAASGLTPSATRLAR
jgi:hypothetical protein